MFEIVRNVSQTIKDNRTYHTILAHLMEETGELATEINIETGISYKEASNDGIVGESIDVIINALDIIFTYYPNITKEEFTDIMNRKLLKWLKTTGN